MAGRPTCVLIGALGGQGGGVLVDWLVEAAQFAGYPAQATSIPGVAQRTGATTYYFEIFPEPDRSIEPVFSLFPSADDIDLVAAMEPTEAGRALEKGWVTERTTVITTGHRIYSTAEKSVAGDGRVDPIAVLEALAAAAHKLILIEVSSGAQLNASMLGAIAGTGILPLDTAALRDSIERRGLAVADNLAAFEQGLKMVADSAARPPQAESSLRYQPAPSAFATELRALPEALRELIGHALARLSDYQDTAYGRLFLNRFDPILAADDPESGYRLARETARRLAAWMSYEDIMRVAQLKTRPGRLRRIRAEAGAEANDPVLVYDYFKPRLSEISAIMPRPFGGWMRGVGATDPSRGLRLRWPTATPLGYGLLKLLAWLRRWRGSGSGYRREQDAIEAWLKAVRSAAPVDYELAVDTARLAVWARGYGPVRERGLERLARIWAQWETRLAGEPEALHAEVKAALEDARSNPDPE